jgi:3-dehydroquinate synthase
VTDGKINVELGSRSYPVYTGSRTAASFARTCREHSVPENIVLITDHNVSRYYLKPLLKALIKEKFLPLTIEIPAGEMQKSLARADAIYTLMLKKRIPRDAAVIALGGGVIGDLAGFVAATYQRGIKLIQVPTTLLAQVDSSIGGKVGINHPLGKNMIGAFHQPLFVWADTSYLKTLPKREIICGIGEVVKYGIIRSEKLFGFLESNLERIIHLDEDTISFTQLCCAGIKAEIVSQDEKESGVRIILNCGHTVGHGLEAAGRYRMLKHGEAVLLGLAAESHISMEMGLIDRESHGRILSLICRIPMQKRPSGLKMPTILNAIGRDKKHLSKKLRFVLPAKIGDVKIVDNVKPGSITTAVKKVLD